MSSSFEADKHMTLGNPLRGSFKIRWWKWFHLLFTLNIKCFPAADKYSILVTRRIWLKYPLLSLCLWGGQCYTHGEWVLNGNFKGMEDVSNQLWCLLLKLSKIRVKIFRKSNYLKRIFAETPSNGWKVVFCKKVVPSRFMTKV